MQGLNITNAVSKYVLQKVEQKYDCRDRDRQEYIQ